MNASVCLPIALNKTFDYAVPPEMEAKIKKGLRVKVPFGSSLQTGFVAELNVNPKLPAGVKLKEISQIQDSRVFYGRELFELAEFIEKTYANTLGETLNVLVPPFLNDKLMQNYEPPPQKKLPLFFPSGIFTNSQNNAALQMENAQFALFFGDTFSGKTEAALGIAHKILFSGGQVLILVPDIISSAELIEAVRKKFADDNIRLWHSKVALSRRKAAASDIFAGRPCVIIGTRSACLLPFTNLKLSIIFNEEDQAFKQEDSKPYYHSREVLLERSRLLNSKLIFVSATPSLETLLLRKEGKIKTLNFNDKIPGFDNEPQVYIAPKSGKDSKYISDGLKEAIRQNLTQNGQSLLIINRLGGGGSYTCLNCRAPAKCKKCGMILSYGARGKEDYLLCNRCSSKESLQQVCPLCRNEIFRSAGGGTRAAVEDLEKMFPSARIMRLDSGTLRTKEGEGHYISNALHTSGVDIVVGTFMALRVGLLESKINLIALLDADGEFNSPDFRSGEHFAQKLFNLKGRLRRVKNGKFIVQASNGLNFDFSAFKENDYLKFAQNELDFRKEFNFPPYIKIVKLLVSSKNKKDLDTYTQIILDAINGAYSAFMQVKGPVRAGLETDKLFRQYLLVKSLDDAMLKGFIKTLYENRPPKQVMLKVIVDPYNF
ncbi:MAG: primosomal protein N' [Elusimicrobiota bacterium]|jgi:primosomal protein N' (replication factor Y)|nr:primosomal protein N' [Elusimicrobiota bacterium]